MKQDIEICPNCGSTNLEHKGGVGGIQAIQQMIAPTGIARSGPALICKDCEQAMHPLIVDKEHLKEVQEEIKERGEINYFEEKPNPEEHTKINSISGLVVLVIVIIIFLIVAISNFI